MIKVFFLFLGVSSFLSDPAGSVIFIINFTRKLIRIVPLAVNYALARNNTLPGNTIHIRGLDLPRPGAHEADL